MKIIFSLVPLVFLIGCGKDREPSRSSADVVMTEAEAKESAFRPGDESKATVIQLDREKPVCSEKNTGALIYVIETKTFSYCEKNDWVEVDLKGKDGADGKDGTSSKALSGLKVVYDAAGKRLGVFLNDLAASMSISVFLDNGLAVPLSTVTGRIVGNPGNIQSGCLYSDLGCTGQCRVAGNAPLVVHVDASGLPNYRLADLSEDKGPFEVKSFAIVTNIGTFACQNVSNDAMVPYVTEKSYFTKSLDLGEASYPYKVPFSIKAE